MTYEYRCKILRIVDGDTVDVDIDLGFGIWIHKERVRIVGIDTPESRTKNAEEKIFGLAAKEHLKFLLPIGSMQIIATQKDKPGKFGRILGDFIVDDTYVSILMMESYHAVPYNAENKETLTELHEINRRKLREKGLV